MPLFEFDPYAYFYDWWYAPKFAQGPAHALMMHNLMTPKHYGTEDYEMQVPRAHGKGAKRKQNSLAICLAAAVPACFFLVTSDLMSSQFYYQHPDTAILFVGGMLLKVFVIGVGALIAHKKQQLTGEQSWWSFIFFTSLLAVALGVFFGHLNFHNDTRRYYDYMSLRRVVDVDPARNQGQQELDAGQIDFQAGTTVDRSKSMAFHKSQTWCVAPIVSGNGPLANYDFWAVGMDCCSTRPGDFSCGPNWAENPTAMPPAGIRVFDQHELTGYQLAVNQAMAAYDIQSRHPIFLYMTKQPYQQIKAYAEHGQRFSLISSIMYLLFHCFYVYVQAKKMGTGVPSGYFDVDAMRRGGGTHH